MKNLCLILILTLFTFFSCEKEAVSPVIADANSHVSLEKANNECAFDGFVQDLRDFTICGTEYTLHTTLHFINNEGIHYIQASSRCYKRGGDPNELVKNAKMAMELNGEMHIWCTEPIDIHQPTGYNVNLINGEVPNTDSCNDCGQTFVHINYAKNITQIPGDRLKLEVAISMEECGEIHEDFVTIVL